MEYTLHQFKAVQHEVQNQSVSWDSLSCLHDRLIGTLCIEYLPASYYRAYRVPVSLQNREKLRLLQSFEPLDVAEIPSIETNLKIKQVISNFRGLKQLQAYSFLQLKLLFTNILD